MATSSPLSIITGETSLSKLLSTLTLTLHAPTYVFLNIPSSDFDDQSNEPGCLIPLGEVLFFFREPQEGVTVVVEIDVAERYPRISGSQDKYVILFQCFRYLKPALSS